MFRKISFVFIVLITPLLVCAIYAEGDSTFVTMAIVKFGTLPKDAETYLGQSFSESLSTKLSGLKGIKLYERAQFSEIVSEIERSQEDLFDENTVQHIGKMVAVDYIIVGTVTHIGDRLRVNARITEIKTTRNVLAEELNGKYEDIFDLQDALAMRVIEALHISLSDFEKKKITEKPTESFDVYMLYNRLLAEQDKETKIELLKKVLEEDPGFIQALRLLAETCYEIQNIEESINTYTKLLAIKPDDYDARYNTALLYFEINDLRAAEDNFLYASKVDPGDPDVWYHLALLKEYNDNGERQGPGADLETSYQYYKTAISLNENHAPAHYALGLLSVCFATNSTDLKIQKNYLELAIFHLNSYLEFCPDAFNKEEVLGNIELLKQPLEQLNKILNE